MIVLLSTTSLSDDPMLINVPSTMMAQPAGIIFVPASESPEGLIANVAPLTIIKEDEYPMDWETDGSSVALLSIISLPDGPRPMGFPETVIAKPQGTTFVSSTEKPGESGTNVAAPNWKAEVAGVLIKLEVNCATTDKDYSRSAKTDW